MMGTALATNAEGVLYTRDYAIGEYTSIEGPHT